MSVYAVVSSLRRCEERSPFSNLVCPSLWGCVPFDVGYGHGRGVIFPLLPHTSCTPRRRKGRIPDKATTSSLEEDIPLNIR